MSVFFSFCLILRPESLALWLMKSLLSWRCIYCGASGGQSDRLGFWDSVNSSTLCTIMSAFRAICHKRSHFTRGLCHHLAWLVSTRKAPFQQCLLSVTDRWVCHCRHLMSLSETRDTVFAMLFFLPVQQKTVILDKFGEWTFWILWGLHILCSLWDSPWVFGWGIKGLLGQIAINILVVNGQMADPLNWKKNFLTISYWYLS